MMRSGFMLIRSLGSCWNFPVSGVAQSLREEADGAGILLGTAMNVVYLSEPAYTDTLAREFNNARTGRRP